jgi:hypothetical protein
MPGGRPTTYNATHAEQARKLCRNGATDREVADILGICIRTFYRWRIEHDDFAAALVTGKEIADDRVERALYQRACGYEYDDVKIFNPAGAKEPVEVPVTIHVPADVAAARHWLAMRRPSPWAARKESAEEGDLSNELEEAMARVAEYQKECEAAEARRFAEAVETAVADRLARHGIRE